MTPTIDDDTLLSNTTYPDVQDVEQPVVGVPVPPEQPVGVAPAPQVTTPPLPVSGNVTNEHGLTANPVVIGGPEPTPESTAPVPGEQPPRRQARASREVMSAIDEAARLVPGSNVEYLRSLANVESSFDPAARAGTSTAAGLFQFIEGTWLETLKRFGGVHGFERQAAAITRRADGRYTVDPTMRREIMDLRLDARANAIMAANFARENARGLSETLGRSPTSGEQYMAHFLGPGGAQRFLRADRNALATSAIGADQADANRRIFFNPDGSPRTVGQVLNHFERRMGNVSITEDNTARRPIGQPIQPNELDAPPLAPVNGWWRQAELEAQRWDSRERTAGFFDTFSREFNSNTLTARLIQAAGSEAPDPNFRIQANWNEWTKDIREEYHGRFAYAVSAGHAERIRGRILSEQKLTQDISEAGISATAGSILAHFVDPPSLAIGIASGGLAGSFAVARGAGQVASRAAGAVGGAAGNVAIEGASAALAGDDGRDMTTAIMVGAAFGAAFTPIGRNVRLHAALAAKAREDLMDHTAMTAPPRIPGAASLGAGGSDRGFALNDEIIDSIGQADVAQTLGQRFRISSGGQLAASTNPFSRLVGNLLGVDMIGKADGAVNQFGADQEVNRMLRTYGTAWASIKVPAYHEWADAKGLSWLQSRVIGTGHAEFFEEVHRAQRTRDENLFREFHPTVQRAALERRRLFQLLAEGNQNPLAHMGRVGRSVQGAEDLKPDPFWAPRMWAVGRFGRMAEKLRSPETDAVRLFSGAILSAQPELGDEIAIRLGKAIYRRQLRKGFGFDDEFEQAMGAGRFIRLKQILKDEEGWDEPMLLELERRLRGTAGFKSASDDAGNPSYLKFRIDLNEDYYLDGVTMADGSMGRLRITDYLETNADVTTQLYMRRAVGRIALARQEFVREDGTTIINGITSDAEFDNLIEQMRTWGAANGQSKDEIDKDVANARWLYSRILGQPDPSQNNEMSDWLRLLRTYNFGRLMNQIGFAQVMDAGRMIGAFGIPTFIQHVGGFRRIKDMDGRLILRHGLDRELEAAIGAGSDQLRIMHGMNLEDAADLYRIDGTRFVDKANIVMDRAAQVTSTISGMHAINSALQLMTGRMAAQKFADLATKAGGLTARDKHRLKFLGLSDDMQERVIKEIRAKFSTEDGSLFGRKVTKMNLDKWDDQEANVAFQQALYRLSRHIVQENDAGMLHRVMSNPIAQTLLQFRTYSIVAWENQLLHGLNQKNFDMRQFMMFSMALMTGALVYAVQTQLQAVGRNDAREFVEDRLSLEKWGLAAFQRAGWTALAPMGIDTIFPFLNPEGTGLFNDTRASGQASHILFGNPTFSLFDDTQKATRAIVRGLSGEPLTQQEARGMLRPLLYQNSMPFIQIFSTMTSGMPATR